MWVNYYKDDYGYWFGIEFYSREESIEAANACTDGGTILVGRYKVKAK